MRIFAWHFMPWPHLPADFDSTYESGWIVPPNALFDPRAGADVYASYLDELVRAEGLGFDGVVLNEHHQNSYGLMPAPNLIAAALSRLTSRVRIVVLGNLLAFHLSPVRIAEEYAMIDLLSRGRLIAGLAVGMAAEFYSYNLPPMTARRRFWEGVDVLVRAWTETGPFPFKGDHFTLPYVNPWPRPLQNPPEIWIPGSVSTETMVEVARRGFGYFLSARLGAAANARAFARFRDVLAREGAVDSPYRAGQLITVYVGENDRQAREEAEGSMWYFLRRNLLGLLRRKGRSLTVSPFTTSLESYERYFTGQNWEEGQLGDARDWDDLRRFGSIVVGGPQTVLEGLVEAVRTAGVGNLLLQFQFGDLSHERTLRSMELFAREVAPALREQGDEALKERYGPGFESIDWRRPAEVRR